MLSVLLLTYPSMNEFKLLSDNENNKAKYSTSLLVNSASLKMP